MKGSKSSMVKESLMPLPTSPPAGLPFEVEIWHTGRAEVALNFLQAASCVTSPRLSTAITSKVLRVTSGLPFSSAAGRLITAYFCDVQMLRLASGLSKGMS